MMYNELKGKVDFMGLHMYLYKATRKSIEDLKHLKEVENDLNKMWEPIIANELPKNWYGDKSNITDNQRKLFDEMYNESNIIEQKRRAILNEMGNIDECNDGYIGYWRDFNYLHEYIVDNFADGVDECQLIPLTKDDVVKILNHLNKIDDVLSSLNMEMRDDYNYYCTCDEVPDEIQLPLVLVPYDGRLFGQIVFYKSFVKNIKKSIDIFSMIERELDAEHCVCYRASW